VPRTPRKPSPATTPPPDVTPAQEKARAVVWAAFGNDGPPPPPPPPGAHGVKTLPERRDLVFAGELLGWPPVRVGGAMFAGEEGWRQALTGPRPLTPIGRVHALIALRRPLLTLTATGRRRLRTWLDAQRGEPMAVETPAARRARIAEHLAYFGDDELLSLVVSTVASLPRPIADHVVDECMFITAGHSTSGWTSRRFTARLPIVIAGHRAPAAIAPPRER